MKHRTLRLLGYAMVIAMLLSVSAFAGEKIIDTKIDSLTFSLDKKGNEYARVIITETRAQQGISYQLGLPMMGFGSVAQELKSYAEGQRIKAVVSTREYQGRQSYTILKLVPVQ